MRIQPAILILFIATLLYGCDSPTTAPISSALPSFAEGPTGSGSQHAVLNRQLAAARAASARYHRLEAALADGYQDIDVFIPGMGYHYLNPALLDDIFHAGSPEILVYAQEQGRMRLVAIEYAVPLALADQAPGGFAADADVWDRNESFQLWTLHAWVWMHNPAGLFAPHNPRLM